MKNEIQSFEDTLDVLHQIYFPEISKRKEQQREITRVNLGKERFTRFTAKAGDEFGIGMEFIAIDVSLGPEKEVN